MQQQCWFPSTSDYSSLRLNLLTPQPRKVTIWNSPYEVPRLKLGTENGAGFGGNNRVTWSTTALLTPIQSSNGVGMLSVHLDKDPHESVGVSVNTEHTVLQSMVASEANLVPIRVLRVYFPSRVYFMHSRLHPSVDILRAVVCRT
jgi:hypothetical protein